MINRDTLEIDERVKKLKEIGKSISYFLTIASLITMVFNSIAWIYKNDDLTPAANFFYFITLMMNLYFPILFLNIFAELKSSKEEIKKEVPILSEQDIYTISFSNVHPIIILILSLVISWTDFNSISYFVVTLISIIFIDSMAILFARKYYINKNDVTKLTIFLIALAVWGMTMHILQPFSTISRWRFIIKVILYICVGIISLQYRSKSSKKKKRIKEKKEKKKKKKPKYRHCDHYFIRYLYVSTPIYFSVCIKYQISYYRNENRFNGT